MATLCCCHLVFAHEQKAALTSVVLSERSNSIEVTHRFRLHDAEHAVKHLLGKEADIYQSSDTQQQFAAYVYQHFAMHLFSGQSLAFEPIGFELEGKFFWVYQEAPMPADASGFTIQQNALLEIWPSQVNTVNLESAEGVKTLTFSKENQRQSLVLGARRE